jgi:hypothetical protein
MFTINPFYIYIFTFILSDMKEKNYKNYYNYGFIIQGIKGHFSVSMMYLND